MTDGTVGTYLLEKSRDEPYETTEEESPKMRRFVHYQRETHNPRVIGKGKHGVAILVLINGVKKCAGYLELDRLVRQISLQIGSGIVQIMEATRP